MVQNNGNGIEASVGVKDSDLLSFIGELAKLDVKEAAALIADNLDILKLIKCPKEIQLEAVRAKKITDISNLTEAMQIEAIHTWGLEAAGFGKYGGGMVCAMRSCSEKVVIAELEALKGQHMKGRYPEFCLPEKRHNIDEKIYAENFSLIVRQNPTEAVQVAAISGFKHGKRLFVKETDGAYPKNFEIECTERKNPDRDAGGGAVWRGSTDVIHTLFVENPTEAVWLAAISKNADNIQFIENPTEEMQFAAVRKDPFAIKHIHNPTKAVMMEAIALDAAAIFHINKPDQSLVLKAFDRCIWAIELVLNPTEEMQLKAVEREPSLIKHLQNPSEAVQLAAVKREPWAIQHIDDPPEMVQIAAAEQNGSAAIKSIKNPTEAAMMAVVKNFGACIEYIANPSENVQLEAVKNSSYALKYIQNPTEAVQLAAVGGDPSTIQYIKEPSEAVQLAAVEKDAAAISHIKNPCKAAVQAIEKDKKVFDDFNRENMRIALERMKPKIGTQINALKMPPKNIV